MINKSALLSSSNTTMNSDKFSVLETIDIIESQSLLNLVVTLVKRLAFIRLLAMSTDN